MSNFKKKFEDVYGPLEGLNEEPGIQGKVSIEDLVRRQIDRTLISESTDPTLFEANVQLLMSMLPSGKLKALYAREAEFKTKIVDMRPEWCGRRVGPLKTEKQTDYLKLFELVLEAFEDCGLTWKIKNETVELGRVKLSTKSPKPTPYFDAEKAELEKKKMDELTHE
jgi:hypothetical protein